MSVTVHIWTKTKTSSGHAALNIGGSHYVSYWPDREGMIWKDAVKNPPGKANIKDFSIGVTHESRLTINYRADKFIMKREAVNIILDGLNEALMIKAWNDFKLSPQRFNAMKHNCSTVVSSLLELGSGIPYSGVPTVHVNDYARNVYSNIAFRLRFLKSSISMWTPTEVHKYSNQLLMA